eukprot:CAMPEP_0202433884 /NCGR_PEP_ID=MMETSP1345-20130828/13558_1 /ASSEMBLY_ACC=CAM_ASM_000843 /TAXON_ID=342563 /ORGANISM="Fabrea Fabrea salina" /LENGTH=401 /DNA_ID=CAMNT_0049046359 /DNA_START=583 /DNA_END=1785 /DNA_ORIENTATION=-
MGSNNLGQLGTGTKQRSASPVKVRFSKEVHKISLGQHSAAIVGPGELYVWGSGIFGEFLIPQLFMKQVSDLNVGGSFGACLDQNGSVWSWGSNNNGELGTGDFEPRKTPARVSGLENKIIREVVCGGTFTVALGENVTLKAPSETSRKRSLWESPDVSIDQSRVEALEMQLREKEFEIADLKDQLQREREINYEMGSIQNFEHQSKQIQQYSEELVRKNQELQELSSANTELKQELQEHYLVNSQLKQEIQQLNDRISDLQERFQEDLNYHESLEAALQELNTYKKNQEYLNCELLALKREKEQLTKSLNSYKALNQELSEEVKTYAEDKEHLTRSLQLKLEDLNSPRCLMSPKVSTVKPLQRSSLNNYLSQIRERLSNLHESKAQLEQKVETYKRKLHTS